MRPLPLLLTLLIVFTGVGWSASGHAFESAQSYVEPQLLPPSLLPPPPAEGSAAWRDQADAVAKAQRKLPEGEIAAIRDEQHMRLELMTSVIGAFFTRDKFPKTFTLLDRALASAGQVSEADKKFWRTRRPYLADPRIHLYVDPIDASPSYPSGHTTDSRARADAIALHRIEAGVHYPVDIDGGRMLAMLVVGTLLANDDFQDDLAAAKKEMQGK